MSEIVEYDAKSPRRSTGQIERDMDVTRERLVGTIAQIENRVKPANLVKKQKAKVNEFYKADDGAVRWDRVGMTAGGVAAALIGVRMTSRSIRWLFGAPRQRTPKQQVVYVPVPAPALAAPAAPAAITAA